MNSGYKYIRNTREVMRTANWRRGANPNLHLDPIKRRIPGSAAVTASVTWHLSTQHIDQRRQRTPKCPRKFNWVELPLLIHPTWITISLSVHSPIHPSIRTWSFTSLSWPSLSCISPRLLNPEDPFNLTLWLDSAVDLQPIWSDLTLSSLPRLPLHPF